MINQTNDATMVEQLHKDMDSRVMCNSSKAMSLNSTLDGHHLRFIYLQTKEGTAETGMFGLYGRYREHFCCMVTATFHRDGPSLDESVEEALTSGYSFKMNVPT